LKVAPTAYVTGLDELEKYLKDKEDKYLKTSHYRGDLETQHFTNSFLMQTWFDVKRNEWGIAKDKIEIMIEDAIESDCEAGFDSPMVDGEIAENMLVGYEAKDCAYVCKIMKQLPAILLEGHDKFKGEFKERGYRGWYSNEVRINKKGIAFFTDLTARLGSPPSEIYCELYKSFSMNVWDLAHGVLPKLEPIATYGVQLILTSRFAEKYWLPVQFPKGIEQWVKLRNVKKTDEGYFCIPNNNYGYIGSVIAVGDDLDKTIEECQERVKLIKGEEIEYQLESFGQIKNTMEAGESYGIKFS
jgi:hypothetical protein